MTACTIEHAPHVPRLLRGVVVQGVRDGGWMQIGSLVFQRRGEMLVIYHPRRKK
jgi:hypothetical protein